MQPSDAGPGNTATEQISRKIAQLADWRGQCLSHIRQLITQAIPDVVEEWKWRGTPVWSHHGIICTGETYKDKVKLTFIKGAALQDPSGLFNASLDGNARRAIDIADGVVLNGPAFMALVQQAAALNARSKARPARKTKG